MQLSNNFTFEELTSTSKTNLLEVNREAALNDPVIINNLKTLATKVLQPIRDFYGKPVKVTSGYRCTELNAAVGGSQTSDHSKGMAADIQIPGIKAEELFNTIKENKSMFNGCLHKCILEKVGGKEWVHIAYRPAGEALGAFYTTTDGRNYDRIA